MEIFNGMPERKFVRLPQKLYTENGIYFITICSKNRELIFGSIKNDRLHPTEIGKTVLSLIAVFNEKYPGLSIYDFVLMPNHLHLLIKRERTARGKIPALENYIANFKGKAVKLSGRPLWQSGYYDHIVRDEADLLRVQEYMQDNPRKWEMDREYREK